MKTLKKILVNVVAILVLLMCTLSLTACEDIKTLKVTVVSGETEYTMEVDLYRHLAPKTCDHIIELVNKGYYNGVALYKSGASSQIMLGDLKLGDDGLSLNTIENKLPSQVYGEFAKNGTVGSNLKNTVGSIGLWRSWFQRDANDVSYKHSTDAMNSGRGTLYIPTEEASDLDGYFCVFGQFDSTSSAYNAISTAFNAETDYESYTVFYTGEYDSAKADENYGLTFNAMLKADYDENKETDDDGVVTVKLSEDSTVTVFAAEGDQLNMYNATTYKVSKTVTIKSVVVK